MLSSVVHRTIKISKENMKFSSTITLSATLLLLSAFSCFAETFPECLETVDGSFVGQADNCQGYIYCNGIDDSYKGDCDKDFYFDSDLQECLFDEEQQCLRDTSEEDVEEIVGIPLETETDEEVKDNIATIAEELNEIVHQMSAAGRPSCDPTKDEYFAYALRCEYYYKCMSGFLSIFRCNFYYAWDHKMQQCRPAEEAECFKSDKAVVE